MIRLAASRSAEFDADAAAAEAFGAASLISALEKIDASTPDSNLRRGQSGQAMSHAMISDGRGMGFELAAKSSWTERWHSWTSYLRTHPTLDKRIAALKKIEKR